MMHIKCSIPFPQPGQEVKTIQNANSDSINAAKNNVFSSFPTSAPAVEMVIIAQQIGVKEITHKQDGWDIAFSEVLVSSTHFISHV